MRVLRHIAEKIFKKNQYIKIFVSILLKNVKLYNNKSKPNKFSVKILLNKRSSNEIIVVFSKKKKNK